MSEQNFQKALYFGLPVRVSFDENPGELTVDCGIIVGLLLPILSWIEVKLSGENLFRFAIYPDDCSYLKALYYFMFKPEKFE